MHRIAAVRAEVAIEIGDRFYGIRSVESVAGDIRSGGGRNVITCRMCEQGAQCQ